ncbi:MAG: urea ABC transporter permease subunit UrtB, partial [Rhodoferax sp.]|nr:urea ABC transporter permease subunit UrtB [Rhodoferax sp.]
MPKRWIHALLLALTCAAVSSAHALTAQQAQALAVGESDDRVAALHAIGQGADERTVAFIRALADDAVKLVAGHPVIVVDDKAVDPVTGAEVALPETAEDVMNNNRMRSEIDNAIATVSLMSPDVATRRAALETLRGNVDVDKLAPLEKALAAETVPALRSQLAQLRAAALLSSDDPALRL